MCVWGQWRPKRTFDVMAVRNGGAVPIRRPEIAARRDCRHARWCSRPGRHFAGSGSFEPNRFDCLLGRGVTSAEGCASTGYRFTCNASEGSECVRTFRLITGNAAKQARECREVVATPP